ncbi:flagellar hook-associated protein 2 [Gottfriedia luciferensis]|uniref:flagellar hook-associated protein 2 n=1 Tax=Gottfriedia luciferensis TaxID=178774 RepID=UPI000B44E59F|nr:flagellar hook-associated protein 2 [Gottfriedia luciferensis]
MVNRINGFSGVLDIDGTVKKLMDAERLPLDKLKAQKQINEWQTQQYRDLNLMMDDFRKQIVDGIGLNSSFNPKLVSSSNESVVSATTKGTSSNTVNTIDQITALATSSRWTSNAVVNNGGGAIDANALLNTVTFSNGYQLGVQKLQFDVTKPDGTTSTVSVDIDGTKDSLNSVITKINNSGVGVSAFYDTTTQKIVFTNKATGTGANIKINESGSGAGTTNFMQAIGFTVDGSNNLVPSTNGSDASFKINGLTTTRKSNTFTVGDITYTLKQTSTAPTTISSSTDTDKVFDTIKAFVDKYNDLIAKVNDRVTQKKYRDYQPLTDDQRATMKDDQIKKWEDKASSGLLRGDGILIGVLNKMRSALGSPVSGASPNLLSSIGITTGDWRDGGKLNIDEAKLKKALQDDPNAVAKLFTQSGSGTDSSDQGIAVRLKNTLKQAIDDVTKKAGKATYASTQFTLGKSLLDLDTRISNFEDRLTQIEDRYYRQFNAMDQAVQKANSQSAQLMQSFGGQQ